MLTNFASYYNLDKSEQIVRSNYMSISYNYFSTVIWKYVVFRHGEPRRYRRVKAFFCGFRCPTASLSSYVSYSSKKKIYILFQSIVFRIKNFYKHVDDTPKHLLVTP